VNESTIEKAPIERLPSRQNRYFTPLNITCRNCREVGHMSRNCPKPQRIVCTKCGEEGHKSFCCPNDICFNCSKPGHKSKDCRERRVSIYTVCHLCHMQGHVRKDCTDHWRQYHLTTTYDALYTCDNNANKRMFCSNCASKTF